MPQRRQPPAGSNTLPETAHAVSSEQRAVDGPNEGAAQASRLDPPRRAMRQLPDFRTRDNIEQ